MKQFVAIVIALVFIIIASVRIAAEWTGVITETHCGAADRAGSAKDIACIKKCVAAGDGKLALLVGDNLFTIANPEKATGHEGHNVKVTGTADEAAKTVTIEFLEMVS